MKDSRCLIALMFVFLLVFGTELPAKDFGFVRWTNPLPQFSSMGMSPEVIEKLIGDDGQLIIVHKKTSSDIWSKGKLQHFEGIRFASAITVINEDADSIRRKLLDIMNWHEFMPQVQDETILDREEKDFIASYLQVYNLPGPLNLRARFTVQFTQESNGDVSLLMHEGDVDTGVFRWEFMKIDNNRTLVVLSSWQDLESAGLAFRALLKAQPELKPVIPVIATSMYLQQLNNAFRQEIQKPAKAKPRIPFYGQKLSGSKVLESLIERGTVILVHPEQYVEYSGKDYSLTFTTAMNVMEGSLGKVKPISSNYQRMGEYFPWAYRVDTQKTELGENVDLFLNIKLPVISMKLRNTLESFWVEENTLAFEAKAGAMYPMFGAWEYIPLENGHTMMAFTSTSKIGEDANWMLKMMRNIPLTDLVMSIYMGMMILENQKPWVEAQLKVSDKAQ